jgi:hypothetical protein
MVMDHEEALERIEIAAAEPEGLDRLMAGDTTDSAAVAGHLAGCPACTAQLGRIRRTSALARDVILAAPDPGLRERTLAYVKAAGVARGPLAAPVTATAAGYRAAGTGAGAAAGAGAGDGAPLQAATRGETDSRGVAALPPASAPPAPVSIEAERARRTLVRLRVAVVALAAALVVAVAGGVVLYRNSAADATALAQHRATEVAVLENTSRAALRVTAQPDAERVELVATPTGGAATGTLVYSATSGELVAVASHLVPETVGQEYGCWVEVNGTRTRLGRMYWAGDLWTWAGPVEGLSTIPAGATFGVSLTSTGANPAPEPLLLGEL